MHRSYQKVHHFSSLLSENRPFHYAFPIPGVALGHVRKRASVPKVAKAASNSVSASASAEIPEKVVVQKASSGNNNLAKLSSVLPAGASGVNGLSARAAAARERGLGSENAKVIIAQSRALCDEKEVK